MRNMMREILFAFWKIHILHHAAERPVYGQWIIEELRRHGYEISPGTLYPLLRRMERAGWIRPSPRRDGLSTRRDYLLAPGGREALTVIRRSLRELNAELFGPGKGSGIDDGSSAKK